MTGLHGRPEAGELVTAVREFLHDKLLPGAAGSDVFYLRIAINALGMVERELSGNDPPNPVSRQLGWADDADLAAAIRSGAIPAGQHQALAEALLSDVTARLQVANPLYLARYEPDDFEGGPP
jgi:hypothetical protein